ncbi:hypothetical protein BC827DRAFT_1308232 [Russula dissimulans]|nr:hypothetical protein BC827DRAFT_1308232 [Russula dissimulans]
MEGAEQPDKEPVLVDRTAGDTSKQPRWEIESNPRLGRTGGSRVIKRNVPAIPTIANRTSVPRMNGFNLPAIRYPAAQRSTTGPYLAQAGRLSAKKQAPLVVPTRKLFPNTVTLTDPEGIVRPGFHPGSSHATKDQRSEGGGGGRPATGLGSRKFYVAFVTILGRLPSHLDSGEEYCGDARGGIVNSWREKKRRGGKESYVPLVVYTASTLPSDVSAASRADADCGKASPARSKEEVPQPYRPKIVPFRTSCQDLTYREAQHDPP